MAYRSYRFRAQSSKKTAKKIKRNLWISLAVAIFLVYATFAWILPSIIGGVEIVTNKFHPPRQAAQQPETNAALAPPVLNIPYEATYSAQIDIPGYASPNSKVRLYVNDTPQDIIEVGGDGSFIFLSIDLNIGSNAIYGKSVDDKGKESLPSKTLSLLYDDEKPNLLVREPDDGKTIQGGEKKVHVDGKTDPNMTVYVNGNFVRIGSDGNFSTDIPINDGDNDIVIKAMDQAGNTTQVTRKVTYKTS